MGPRLFDIASGRFALTDLHLAGRKDQRVGGGDSMAYDVQGKNTAARRFGLLGLTLLNVGILVGLINVIEQSAKEFTALDFLAPCKRFLSLAAVAVFGWLSISTGSRWVYLAVGRWASHDAATAMRLVVRIAGGGVLLSIEVSTLTGSVTAALTIGSFAGLVVGFATQTVMGNAVAGLFLVFLRPVNIGDQVTVAGHTGEILTVTMMHIVIRTEEQDVLIPTSHVAGNVIVRHRNIVAEDGEEAG